MKRIHLPPLAASLSVLAGHPALAEPIPIDQLGCGNMEITTVFSTGEMTLVSWSVKSIVRDQSDRGEPDMSQHCVGTTLTHGDRRVARGYCTSVYPDGDRTLIEVSREGEGPGTWRFIDGTGKYAGVSGEGSYRFITQARPVEEGTWQFCIQNLGSYTLKE